MPLRWIASLKQANGKPFLEDSLSRYGYLPNPDKIDNPRELPVGFTATSENGAESIGMTCAACHTRQIEVNGTAYRIDGGPAIVEFQSFLADLDAAVNKVVNDPQAFADFAHGVFGQATTPEKEAELRKQVNAWYLPFHTIIARALPSEPWGPSRLDAVAMIFNRLTGLDIGPPPTYLIPDNIQPADAPVRYPFLWNAPIQDKIQWPGFADNGNSILGLSRNLGEVIGVFAVFHPQKDDSRILGINYVDNNSANFHGLNAVEHLIKRIGPPKWPWPVDKALAAKGKPIFDKECGTGCHEIKEGARRSLTHITWATPIQDVGTDSREYNILARTVDTGVMSGAMIPFLQQSLKPQDSAFNVLKTAVTGAILQHYVPVILEPDHRSKLEKFAAMLNPENVFLTDLKGAFREPQATAANAAPSFPYEARVMEGIWAAAPYLHNGSVPTLAELLKPASERVKEFKIGPAYDIEAVGLAVGQSKFDFTLKTTDCSDRNSGKSRCGHEFGTKLSADDKKALLEYLKIL
jgi:cytochrome c5